ncbi:MAG: molybdopterin-dependent oxidoreductase [Dehalococcoidales bacterium]|nr:molybdopterin-dependent oxidoreductase [Dehalococcoidales bacterium]
MTDSKGKEDFSVVNTSPVRIGVLEKATGKARYTDDLSLPNMLYGAILRSPYAHAKILNIDISKAMNMKGVRTVLTGKDVSQKKFGHSPARFDETTLALDRVTYVGDEVAAIAAVDQQTAREALDLIKVEYEELPILLNPLESLKDDAPLIHKEYPRNICQEVHNSVGDIERGFAESYIVRTDRFANRKTDGAPMEGLACLADYDNSGNLTLWSSTQVSHYVQRNVSMVLELPIDRVRIIAPYVGGGFGIKATSGSHELIACMLAMATKQPVKLTLDRADVFSWSRARHQYYHQMKMGVSKDGMLLAHYHLSVLDGGANSGLGIATVYYNGSMLHGPYDVPNMRYDGYRVYTNTPTSGALRGHGAVSNRVLFEAQLNMVAEDLGMDPVEIRLKNMLQKGDHTRTGYYLSSFNARESLESARDDSGWKEKKGRLPKGKGIGVGSSYYISGAGGSIYRTDIPQSTVLTRVAEDGKRVIVHTGSNEIGQGSDTVMAIITAEVLGLAVEDISIISGDTGLCPIDLGAYSSRQTLMTGTAAKSAAESIRDQILNKISEKTGAPVSEFRFSGGLVHGTEKYLDTVSEIRGRYKSEHRGFTSTVSEGPLAFEEITRWIYASQGTIVATGTYFPPEMQYSKDWKGSIVGTSPAYSTQSCIAEVTVDMETGQLTIDKLTLAHDCGLAINWKSVQGQLEGSMCHGLGEALFEEVVFDKYGNVVNNDFGNYKIPTPVDVPDLSALIIESNEPNGPFGAKEAGEGTIIPVSPAIVNAVYDACKVLILDLPITSEKIFCGLQAMKESGAEKYIYKPSSLTDQIIDRAAEITDDL